MVAKQIALVVAGQATFLLSVIVGLSVLTASIALLSPYWEFLASLATWLSLVAPLDYLTSWVPSWAEPFVIGVLAILLLPLVPIVMAVAFAPLWLPVWCLVKLGRWRSGGTGRTV